TLGLLAILALHQVYPHAVSGADRLKGDFVLVLDKSLSMSYTESDGARFDLARKQALRLVERLSPESRLALLLAGDTPERVQGRLSYQHDRVRLSLRAAQPSGSGANLVRALEAAQEIARRDLPAGQPPATVVLFTDMQRATLSTLQGRSEAKTGDPAPLIVVDVGSADALNGSAAGMSLPSRVVPADSQMTITGKVRPIDLSRKALVELYVDERRVEQKYVDPQGKSLVEVPFTLATGAAGAHRGRLHLADKDRMAADQDWHFTFTSGRPARALIVDGMVGSRRTSFFLKAALTPPKAGEGDALSISGLEVDVLPFQQFAAAQLKGYKVVVLADCGDLPDAEWDAIEQWTHDGGGLFVWAGPNTAPANLARRGYQEMARHKGLLPATVGEVLTPETPLAVVASAPEHPLLQHFSPGVLSVLRETRVKRLLKLSADTRDGSSTVVLASGEGHPLLVEKSYGRGRVLLSAVDPGLEFSDLPRRAEAFVTLVLNSVRMLAEREAELQARLGAPLVVSIPNPPVNRQVNWEPPSGAASALKLEWTASEKPGIQTVATVVLPPLEQTGIHRLSWQPQGSGGLATRLFEVNADLAESDLARATDDAVKKAFEPWNGAIVRSVFDAKSVVSSNQSTGSREFSAVVLVLLMGLLLLETYLANRMYRASEEIAPQEAS
ncbi:MAG TPA: VWA domain-containing protein, partial [Planctomycetota bacterium]|nr:VWA domain-containing protein [Planctomycetota bacterium]